VIKCPLNYLAIVVWPPPLVKTVKLDGKYRTTSFFGIKLLKYPFGKKINLKNAPQKRLQRWARWRAHWVKRPALAINGDLALISVLTSPSLATITASLRPLGARSCRSLLSLYSEPTPCELRSHHMANLPRQDFALHHR
jgi:hypothetical protein